MAKFFNQSDIDEFSDCVGLHARDQKNKTISSPEELTKIMRSLGFSPTCDEITVYFKKFSKDGATVDFATFLDIMHEHSLKEKCQQEITAGFHAHDRSGRGTVPGPELLHILTNFGEKLSKQEVDTLFREAGVSAKGEVQYGNIVNMMLTPLPDYGH